MEDKGMQPDAKARPVPLMKLGPNRCKYPVGEMDRSVVGYWMFCNETTESGASYCNRHRQTITIGHRSG